MLHVAVFEDAVPDFVRAGILVQDAGIGEGLLGVDDRIERLILYLHQFGGVVGDARRLGHDRGHGLALVADFRHRHRIVADLAAGVGTNLDEGLRLGGDLRAGQRANHAGQGFSASEVSTLTILACAYGERTKRR